MSTITVVAKGPSAENAQGFIDDCPGTHVAAINDSARLFSGPVDYCCFTHVAFCDRRLDSIRDRVRCFVCPDSEDELPEWVTPVERYSDRRCDGDSHSLISRIVDGGICHHNTVNGALHWLVRNRGYRTVRLIGVDGGTEYAPGMAAVARATHDDIVAIAGEGYLEQWRQVTANLLGVMRLVYGIKVDWYGNT